jgi:hypothetical protein
MFTRVAAQEMFRKTGLVPFNPLAIDRSVLRKTLEMDDIRTEVPPAEEQAREDATAASGTERENLELKMELADMKRKCQVLEEQVHEVTADVRMTCGKKIKFGWGGLINHPDAMARAALEKAKVTELAANPKTAPKPAAKPRDCSQIPVRDCARWTVAALVDELKHRGLKHKGNKGVLVARLLVDEDLKAAKARNCRNCDPVTSQSLGVYF